MCELSYPRRLHNLASKVAPKLPSLGSLGSQSKKVGSQVHSPSCVCLLLSAVIICLACPTLAAEPSLICAKKADKTAKEAAPKLPSLDSHGLAEQEDVGSQVGSLQWLPSLLCCVRCTMWPRPGGSL